MISPGDPMVKRYNFDEKFVLGKGEMAFVGDDLEIYLTEIYFGEEEKEYEGAGEAFKVTLDLKKDSDVRIVDMDTLHEGYGGRSLVEWKHYAVELLNILDNKAEFTVKKTREILEAPEGWEKNE